MTSRMKNNPDDNWDRERQAPSEELMLPTEEFVVLIAAAILLLGLTFGGVLPTLPLL